MSLPYLLSFSRKTDGPRYYAAWFERAWTRGYAEARTSFGRPIRAELGPGAVAAVLGWTRDARPFHRCLELLARAHVPSAWQVTVTDYDRDLEPGRPGDGVDAFLWLRERLPDSRAIEWRYDPIVVSSSTPEAWHLDAFARLARRLRGATSVCNVSIVEPYRKTVRRLGDPSVLFRREGRAGDVRRLEAASEFLVALERIAREHDLELRACANPELPLPASACCSLEMFRGYGSEKLAKLTSVVAPTRPGCRCLKSIDIGMDDTCVAGCRYCYAVSSHGAALAHRRAHDPGATRLR